MDINPNANVGDLLFYRCRGKWSTGWVVEETHTNPHGTVFEVTARRKGVKKKIRLYQMGDDLVYVVPPKEEVAVYLDEIKHHPNLIPIRRFSSSLPSYMLLCVNCRCVLTHCQVYNEQSELVLWNGRFTMFRPQVCDGHEEDTCECEDEHGHFKEYQLGEIEPY